MRQRRINSRRFSGRRTIFNKKGFTLIEMIVIIVIILILGAVLVPNVLKQVGKAQTAACASNRVTLEHQIISELAMNSSETPAQVLSKLAQQNTHKCPRGGVYAISPSNATYDMKYEVVCSKHSGTNLGDPDTAQTVVSVLAKYNSTMDSGAASVSNSSKAAEFINDLGKAGLNLTDLNAKTWRWVPDNTGKGQLYWTPVDIAQLAVGTKIPVMRFNATTGTYTVWIATVQSGKTGTSDESYNVLGNVGSTGYKPSTSDTSKENQSYEKMLEHYEQAVREMG